MRRIYPSYTYGVGPRTGCYWPKTESIPPECESVTGSVDADVGIIGAGFTGLNAALALARAGISVAVMEAKDVGFGASGRNGGFCCLGGAALSRKALLRRYGAAGAAAWYRTEIAAIDHVRVLLKQHEIDADTHSNGETVLAHSPGSMAHLRADCAAIETDYGITPRLIEAEDLAAEGMKGAFHGAMTIPHGFGLNPMKYLAGLARAARVADARIYSHSPVLQIETLRDGYLLHSPQGALRCKQLIVATNGYSSEDLPNWMAGRFLPAQSNVLVTRQLTPEEINLGWSSDQMAYDHRFFLHYFRLLPEGRMLFGMRGGLRSSARADRQTLTTTRRHFETMFPDWADIETPYAWNGLLCLTPDLEPYCGPIPEMPGAFAAFGFHGNGVAMGSYAGAILADLVQDRTPKRSYPAMMKNLPRRLPMGRFRRLALVPPYLWGAVTGG